MELAELGLTDLPPHLLVYEIAGPMFFGAVENFKRALLETRPYPRTLILRLDRVPFMDITGIQTLEEVVGKLRKRGVHVLLCEANTRVHAKLATAGVVSAQPGDGYCATLREALVTAGVGAVPPAGPALNANSTAPAQPKSP